MARAPRRTRRSAIDIIAESQRWKLLSSLPVRCKGRRPRLAAVKSIGLVHLAEGAFRPALQDQVFAEPHQDEVFEAVIVDVERISAEHLFQVLFVHAAVLGLEAQRTASRAAIDVERRALLAACHEKIGQPVAVAVERRGTATDEIFPWATVGMVDASGQRFFLHQRHIGGWLLCVLRCCGGSGQTEQGRARHDGFHCSITSVLRNAIRSLRSFSAAAT